MTITSNRQKLPATEDGLLLSLLHQEPGDDLLSDRRSREMLDALPAAIYTTDAEGRLTYLNQAAIEFSGRVPELGTDKWCVSWKLYHADGRPMPHDECPMAVCLKEGRAVRGVEAIAERPDGTRITFRPYPTPLRDSSGRVIGGLNMLLDVTETERARAESKKTEEQLRKLVALMPAAMYTCEAPSARITFFNEQAAALWGRSPKLGEDDERFCGSFRLWRPDGTLLPHDQTPMATALYGGKSFRNFDVVMERPDGSRINVLVNIDPIFDEKGAVIGAINVFHDTTELKQAQRELLRRTNQLSAFLETAAVGLHRVDAKGVVLWANDAELRLLGYEREEYIGHHISEFHADPETIDDILARLSRGEAIREYEARLRCKDGTIRIVHIDSSVFHEDGRFVHTQCFTRDITARKLAEKALRDEMRRKDEFIATLSHELRNPLAPIRTALQLMGVRGDSIPSPGVREMMERQVNHLVRLVDDLMEMSRISRGTFDLRRERVELALVVRNAIETVAPVMKAVGHKFSVALPPEPVWIDGDPVRLAQIVANLLSNAAKYTDPGGEISLRVSLQGNAALISVRDNGRGIAPEMLPRLFIMFSRSDQVEGRVQDGLGIGLALALRLARMHGGTIEARSDGVGKGSEFTVQLPIAKVV